MKILLIEDDLTLNKLITKALKGMKFSVDQAYDGEEGWQKYLNNTYDIIVLDLNLPYISGIDILKKIRSQDDATKILILSANSTVDDKIMGFNLGATDYLTKPFDILELGVRLDNLLRWQFKHELPKLDFGELRLDLTKKQFYLKGELIPLTRKEYGILEYLMKHLYTYVSAEEIIEHVWETDDSLFSNALKYHISQIRKKINNINDASIVIDSKRNFGYRLKESESID